jgi:hypothetical protein
VLSKLRVPSPALVIAVIALIVAVAGGAFAVAALTNKKAKKIANKVVTRRAPGLSVASAVSANPSVFAQIAPDGTVNTANSKGITQANVSLGSALGYYCFGSLPFAPRGGDAIVDFNNSSGDVDRFAVLGLGAPGAGLGVSCPAGTQVFVDTRKANGTGSMPTGFFIALYH